MTPHTKLGIAGVIVGLILLGFSPVWLGLLVIVLAIAIPTAGWLMLDPSQRRRYRELRRRRGQIHSGRTGEQCQDLPTRQFTQSTRLGVVSSPSEAEGPSQTDRLVGVRKEEPGRVHGGVQASEQRREARQGSESQMGSGDLTVDGPNPGEGSTGVFRITIYWLREGNWPQAGGSAGVGTDGHDMESADELGCLLIMFEKVRLSSQADIDKVELLGSEYQDPAVSKDRFEGIKVAAAEYAASWVEGECDPAWLKTSVSCPLSEGAGLLEGSADWLHGLVENPIVDAASWAGVHGPIVRIAGGITANFVTERLTKPLEDTARVLEVAGVVIGLATGAHPVVISCVKPLASDALRGVLAKAFEKIADSFSPTYKKGIEAPSQDVVQDREFFVDDLDPAISNNAPKFTDAPEQEPSEPGLEDTEDDPDRGTIPSVDAANDQ